MRSQFSTPLLRVLLPLVVGIAAGEWSFLRWANLPFLQVALWAGFFLSLFGLWRSRRGAQAFLHVAMGFLGVLLLWQSRASLQVSWLEAASTYRAIVTEVPRSNATSHRVRLRLLDGAHPQALVQATLLRREQPLRVGDGLLLHARIVPPSPSHNPGEPDFSAFLRRQGVSGVAFAGKADWKPTPLSAPLTLHERALGLRDRLLQQYYRHFSPHDAATLSAMTLGEKGSLDRATRQLFSETGSSHLLALSGLHLALLYGLYQCSLGRWARRKRWGWRWGIGLFGLLLIWSFAWVAGLPLSLVRAALMLSTAQVFALFSQPGRGIHQLTLAALLMLLWQPQWLLDVGFQLSCLAVAGIVLLWPVLEALTWERFAKSSPSPPLLLRGLRTLLRSAWTLLGVSLCAQCATAPLVAYYFHALPWGGVLLSLLAIPVLSLLLGASLLFFLLPFARPLLAAGMSALLHALEIAMQSVASLPYLRWEWWPSERSVLCAYGLLGWSIACVLARHKLRPWLQISGVMLGGLLLYVSIVADQQAGRISEPQLVIYRAPGLCALHLLSPSGEHRLLSSDTLRAQQSLRQSLQHWQHRLAAPVQHWPLQWLRSDAGCEALNRDSLLFAAPHLICFAQERWAVVDAPLSYAYPRRPLSVDGLLLARGVRGHLPHLLRHYRPRVVVLCASLSDFYRERFVQEAKKMHLPAHDIEQEGAYVRKCGAAAPL